MMRLLDRYTSFLAEMVGLIGAGLSPEGTKELGNIASYEEIQKVVMLHYRAIRTFVEAIGRDVMGLEDDTETLGPSNNTLVLSPAHYKFYRRVENDLIAQESLKDEMVDMVLRIAFGDEVRP